MRNLKTEEIESYANADLDVQNSVAVCATLLLVLSGGSEAGAAAKCMEPVDYVSPNVGGIGQLLTATVP